MCKIPITKPLFLLIKSLNNINFNYFHLIFGSDERKPYHLRDNHINLDYKS